MPRRIRPGRLRRRLAIAFILMAGISAGALALGSFLLVRQSRLDESLDRAAATTRSRLTLAQGFLPLDQVTIEGLRQGFRESDQPAVLIVDGVPIPSTTGQVISIPSRLRDLVEHGQIAFDRVHSGLTHLLIVGGRIPGSADE